MNRKASPPAVAREVRRLPWSEEVVSSPEKWWTWRMVSSDGPMSEIGSATKGSLPAIELIGFVAVN
jgi:hypothetical protein